MTGSSSGVVAAARAVRAGGVVVYPTDTLWGFGASVQNPRAVERVLALKDRPSGQPMSVAFSSTEEVERFATLSPRERRWVRRLLPGPVTLLVRPSSWARRSVSATVVGHGRTLGVRVPDHPVARELARLVGPLTATSANRHGEPPVQSITDARREFGRRVQRYLSGGPAPSGRPSQIIDVTRDPPVTLARS